MFTGILNKTGVTILIICFNILMYMTDFFFVFLDVQKST